MILFSFLVGSEPSLVGRNGQHSSANASKRTLNSQENLSPIQHQPISSQLPEGMVTSQAAAADESLVGDPALDESLDTTPKTPSYLKLSCSVSGYNNYNKYGSPKEQGNRIRVLTAENGSEQSGSDLDSETQPITGEQGLPNGCDTTDDASAFTHGATVISNGRTVTEASLGEVSLVNSLPAVNGGDHNVVLDSDCMKGLQNTGLDVSQTSQGLDVSQTSQTSDLQLDLEELEKPSVKPASITSPDTPAKVGIAGICQ